ncbi:uncharacterized protein LOC126809496 [Patella vulgata]|uniref:uncharacterized protein LOC126809496 n=1 Tax=Patella vulgata TaxID=6465 RepID=UPI0024A866B7|nr:uncharacterized protein LOC126809496 [Patella vulgata]
MTMKGACCFRTYSTIVSDIAQGSHRLQVECQSLHFSECQALHRQPHGDSESEVISFTPGMTCEEAGCLTDTGCTKDYKVGDALRLGCQSCTCLNGGGLQCSCEQMTVRKEIRDMTREELVRFQNAVIQLRGFGDVSIWEEYRDLYMKHGMHSNGGQFYLPWHRLFLRRLEQKLREIDCNVVLPYVDFSTDVGDFSNAVIWQTDYFGGDGNSQSGCVTDHPFGGSKPWRPCIMRNFNVSVKLPTAVEIALAIASEDYTEMSLCLETYAAYVHNYIGGDMATSSSPYDPVFYAIHAYIDMLYWSWQKRHDNKFKYPVVFGNIPMIPFNIPPSDALDSEALCVTYALPSKGGMCNVTVPTLPGSPGVQRGDQSPEVVDTINRYNQFGYNIEDNDLLRFNRYGFRPDGFNRDGYDREGYDSYGYNRYGKDREGYDQYGYNIDGVDRNGNQDTSDRYSDDGYDMNCLDRQGLSRLGRDKFGFDINGYDLNSCNAMFNGPFSLIHSFVIMEALGNQAKGFLMTLHRTCEPLDPVPNLWYDQFWVTQIKDVTTMVPAKFSPTQSLPSSRFCIEAEPLLSPCACESTSTTCTENPCLTGLCPAYPEAVCHFGYCGDCKATWYFNNMEVDCHSERGKFQKI